MFKRKEQIMQYVLKQAMSVDNHFVGVGTLLSFFGFGTMIAPFHASPGGFGGLAEIANTLIDLPYLIGYWGLNLILLFFCSKSEKRGETSIGFTVRTGVTTFVLSFLLDMIPANWFAFATDISPFPPVTFGSFLYGVGLGFIVSGKSTTGGTECIGVLLAPHLKPLFRRFFPNWAEEVLTNRIIVILTTLFNVCVITLTGITYGFSNSALSIVALAICMISLLLTVTLLQSNASKQAVA